MSPVVTTLERLLAAGGYRLDLRADATAPVRDLAMHHRARIVALAAARGATNVRFFGSAARGDADDLSDIDFLVDFDTAHGLWPMIELADDLETLLGLADHGLR